MKKRERGKAVSQDKKSSEGFYMESTTVSPGGSNTRAEADNASDAVFLTTRDKEIRKR